MTSTKGSILGSRSMPASPVTVHPPDGAKNGDDVIPGTPWHHRSFTESQLTYQVALCLDWAGSMLTPQGRDLIRDAIARRGLPRMQQDFMDSLQEDIQVT